MPETIERSRPRSHNRERSDKKNIKWKRSRSKSYNRGRSDIKNIKKKDLDLSLIVETRVTEKI